MKVIIHNAIGSNGHIMPLGIDMDKNHDQASIFDEDVILCGSGTILKSKFDIDSVYNFHIPHPQDNDPRPSLAVIDSMARINCWKSLSEAGHWKEFYALISTYTNRAYVSNLIRIGVQPVMTGKDKIDMAKALSILGNDFGHKVCRVESRGVLNNLLLERGLVDVLSIVLYPSKSGKWLDTDATIKWTNMFKLIEERQLGQGVKWLVYEK